MKSIAIGLGLSLLAFNFAQAERTSPDIEIIHIENQRWHFHQVTVTHTGTELTVSGRMNANVRHSLPHGHVDIAAWSADNKLIAEVTSAYSPARLTRRTSRKGGVRFSAKLPALPDDARIKVAFHRDGPHDLPDPVHDETIAR